MPRTDTSCKHCVCVHWNQSFAVVSTSHLSDTPDASPFFRRYFMHYERIFLATSLSISISSLSSFPSTFSLPHFPFVQFVHFLRPREPPLRYVRRKRSLNYEYSNVPRILLAFPLQDYPSCKWEIFARAAHQTVSFVSSSSTSFSSFHGCSPHYHSCLTFPA